MVLHSRRSAALALVAVVGVAAVVGFLGVSIEDGSRDPETTRQSVLDTNRSIDAYEATLVLTTETENRTRTVRYRVAVERPGRQNMTTLAPANRSGTVVLSNRTGSYLYDPNNGTLRTFGDASTTPDILAQFVRALAGEGTDYRGEDRIEGSPGVVLQYSAGGEDVGLRIGGSAPSLRYDAEGRTEDVDVSVWVDPDRGLPVRLNQSYTFGNERVQTRMRLTDLDLDPEFAPGRFRLDVPPDTEVIDNSNVTRTYDSRGALAANASLPVPEPDLPEGYEFRRGTVLETNESSLVLTTYVDGDQRIAVQVSTSEFAVGENATEVEVGTATGYYQAGPSNLVAWECEGVNVTVGGTAGKETTLSVARSIGCRLPG
jgi:outer membrane lipoprotein-sorting protein